MAGSQTHLLVFGDTATDRLSMIQALVRHSKSLPAARTFLEQATDKLNIEFAQLRPEERDWTHSESLLALAEEDANPNVPTSAFLPTILAIVGRLSEIIVRAEQDPSILGTTTNPTHILGFCSGQLAAVAVLGAHDTADMLLIALDILSICVRYIRLTKLLRTNLLAPYETGAWFVTYLGIGPERMKVILDEYHESNQVPNLQRISMGVVGEGWVTLIGTPSSFVRLAASSQEIHDAPHIPTDVGGPSHTHYMPIPDVDEMVGNSAILDRTIDWSKIVMSDPVGGTAPCRHPTLRHLIGEVLINILSRPLLIEKATKVCISRLQDVVSVAGKAANLKVHPMGTSPHMTFVQKCLKSANLEYELAEPTLLDLVDPTNSTTRGSSDLVAIVGMSGRFPDNETIDGFWEDLVAGKCHIKKIPKSRFDVDRYYDATHKLKNSTAAKEGAWLRDPGLFDNRFFNISPREAMQLDPVARLALTTAHEALEMAGYYPGATPSTSPDRVATFFGITGMDWTENLHQNGLDIYAVSSIAKAFITGRLNYTYKFGRGCYSLDAACASSTTAITLAVQGLLSRDCDMAIAGGASVFSSPFAFSALSRSGMLAYEGGCRAFHDDADGYARSEGVGMVVLKRLEDAMADNDNILGVIRGAARSYSTTSTSITHPSHVSQEKTFREVLGRTAVDPEEISYVEMHGTGTQAGDFEEMTSVLNVVGGQRTADNPLTVGAVKAAVGHGEGVAGVTSLIKVLTMLKRGRIPPQPGAPFKINSRFPRLDTRNVRISMSQTRLQASPKAKDHKVRMLLNSFDASGGICSLVVEEAPAIPKITSPDPRTSHVIALSARTPLSLQKNCERLLEFLERNPTICLEHLAYTTTARRMHYELRKAFVASSVGDVKRQLADHLNTSAIQSGAKKPQVPSVVFLFTGQSSQYTAMGKSLFQTSKYFRSLLRTYQSATKVLSLPDFLPIFADENFDLSTASPAQVQISIVALELAVTAVLRSWGIVPDVVMGHSLGEYAALCVSGVLSPSDTLYLVGRRAQLMEEHLEPDTYGMLATNVSAADLEARIKKEQVSGEMSSCGIACLNSPGTTVASGNIADLTRLKDTLAAEGISSILLRVPFGFHSSQLQPVLPALGKLGTRVVFNKPRIPIVSSLSGNLVTESGVFNAHYLTRQAREPVNFLRALRSAESAGYTATSSLWIETGPNPILLSLVKKTLDVQTSRILPAFKEGEENWSTLGTVLKASYENGIAVQWPVYHSEFSGSLRMLPDLPSYSWDYKEYWIPYTSPPAWEIEEALKGIGNGERSVEFHQKRRKDQLPSSTLHVLENEDVNEDSRTMEAVFSSDTSSPRLQTAIEGHIVNGHKVTPLGLFCEMALAASKYCRLQMENGGNGEEPGPTTMRITELTLEHPVILSGSANPIILTAATYSAAKNSTRIVFQYKTDAHGIPKPVGSCHVLFTPPSIGESASIAPSLLQTVHLIKARIAQLQSFAAAGQSHRLLRPVVYNMFSSYVRYSTSYHAMDEVILSSGSEDAVASITAPITDRESLYVCNPYLYDGATHVAGFLANNGLRFDDPDVICMANGFTDSCIWKPLVAGKAYTTYVSLHEVVGSNGRFEGSCYIFDAENGQLLGLYSGFRFQKMKKTVLNYVLGGFTKAVDRARPSETEQAFSGGSHFQVTGDVDGASDRTQIHGHVAAPIENTITAPRSSLNAFDIQDQSITLKKHEMIDRILEIAAAEAGCSTSDMVEEAPFDDLGIDSLLAIAVLSRCNNELGLYLPPTFFLENRTVNDAKKALAEKHGLIPSAPSSAKSSESDELIDPMTPADSADEQRPVAMVLSDEQEIQEKFVQFSTENDIEQVSEMEHGSASDKETTINTPLKSLQSPQLASNGILTHLKGPNEAPTTLFLFADESGSSSNYKQVTSLDLQMNVYGVNWAVGFDTRSEEEISIQQIAAICASIVRTNIDPAGRTILGGVGIGGVLAVEVGKLLDNVAGLLVLDPAAASKDAILRTMKRLKRMRTLRPAQETVMTLAANLMALYQFLPVEDIETELVAIAPKTDLDWAYTSKWLPGVVIHDTKLQTELFFRQPIVLRNQIQGILAKFTPLRN